LAHKSRRAAGQFHAIARSEADRSAASFYASATGRTFELVDKMCENRKPTEDVDAIREELSALIRLSNEKLEEMKLIQQRIDAVTAEITQLTKQLENLNEHT
jgi:seryl-tRNA synthetase